MGLCMARSTIGLVVPSWIKVSEESSVTLSKWFSEHYNSQYKTVIGNTQTCKGNIVDTTHAGVPLSA